MAEQYKEKALTCLRRTAENQIFLAHVLHARHCSEPDGLQDQTGSAGKYVGSELDLRLAWTVSPNLLLEGGWMYLIKGSYYSNLVNQGVAGAPNDKNTDYVFLSMRLFF